MSEQAAGAVPEFTFGHRVARAREFAGLTQGELADRIAVSKTTICNWETGSTHPTERKVKQAALSMGVSYTWLRYGTTDPLLGGGNSVVPGAATDQYPDSYRHAQRLAA